MPNVTYYMPSSETGAFCHLIPKSNLLWSIGISVALRHFHMMLNIYTLKYISNAEFILNGFHFLNKLHSSLLMWSCGILQPRLVQPNYWRMSSSPTYHPTADLFHSFQRDWEPLTFMLLKMHNWRKHSWKLMMTKSYSVLRPD